MSTGAGGGEKTEKPTPKRLREARKEGQVPRTPDVGAWAGILSATFILPAVVAHVGGQAQELLVRGMALVRAPEPGPAVELLGDGLLAAVLAALMLGAPLLLLALATNVAQGGLHVAGKMLKPQAKRLNPLQGLKRLAGPHALWELAKALLKSVVVGLLVYRSIAGLVPVLVASGHLPLSAVLAALVGALLSLARGAAAAGLVMALADYAVVRRRIGKQLRMSRQEIKEELRQSEGDPHVRGAIRSRQLAMSRNRMIADVAEADVVLVNPTHVAVALRYEPSRGAPRVVAKGAGAIAARIREEAATRRVPMVSDVPLARALYRSCEVGTEIPPELFTAVARVLAFILSLKSRGSAAGVHRLPTAG